MIDRRRFLERAPLFLGGLLLAPSLSACSSGSRLTALRTFFVDARRGNDRNNGLSEGEAWQSLARVNGETFRPGDRVLFKAGEHYLGQLKPQGAGALEAEGARPILFSRYGEGAAPSIDGEGKVPAAVHLYNIEFVELEDLAVTNTGAERQARRTGVRVEIADYGTARGIALRRLHIHDVNGSLVKKEGGGTGIGLTNGGNERKSRFDGLTIEDCHIERCARNGITGGGYWRRDQWHPNLNVVIRRNLLEGVPGDGIVPIGCDGALVEHNVMRDCPSLLPSGDPAAGIWPWSSDNTVIQFNEVSDHKAPWDGQGFDADWNCRGTIIQYNYSHDNEGGFLLVCNDGNAGPPASIGNVGSIIRYNISVNDGIRAVPTHAGVFSPLMHITGPVKDTKIYNNLIISPPKPPGDVDRTLVKMENWGGPWPENTLFANNIFDVSEETSWDEGKAAGTRFSSNLWNGPFVNLPGEAVGIQAPPRYAAPPPTAPAGINNLEGYKLAAGSPAIDAGTLVENHGGRDFWGRPVPTGGRVDIGPGEHPSDG